MPDQQNTIADAVLQFLYRHWPSLLGGIVALNWQPKESTWRGRAFAGFSAVALSAMFSEPAAELLSVDSPTLRGGIAGCISLFGLLVAQQIALAVSDLRPLIVAWLRRVIGV